MPRLRRDRPLAPTYDRYRAGALTLLGRWLWLLLRTVFLAGRNSESGARRPKRRPPPPPWVRVAVRVGLVFGLCAVIAGVPTFLVRSGWVDRQMRAAADTAYDLSAGIGLAVDRVEVFGRAETDRTAILEALDVAVGSPILRFDPHAAKLRLEQIGWVREATVERHMPDLVRVILVEREPVALWQRSGRLALMDRDGRIVSWEGVERYGHLLVLVGDDAPDHALELFAMLSRHPEIGQRVEAAVRVGARRWNLRLRSGVDIRLPEIAPDTALAALTRIDHQHGVLARPLELIDLRLPDRMILRTHKGQEDALPAPATDGAQEAAR